MDFSGVEGLDRLEFAYETNYISNKEQIKDIFGVDSDIPCTDGKDQTGEYSSYADDENKKNLTVLARKLVLCVMEII